VRVWGLGVGIWDSEFNGKGLGFGVKVWGLVSGVRD